MSRRKIYEQAARKAVEAEVERQQMRTPNALPRGLQWRFTLNEWRLLAGVEINAVSRLAFDFYLGIGPLFLRVTL